MNQGEQLHDFGCSSLESFTLRIGMQKALLLCSRLLRCRGLRVGLRSKLFSALRTRVPLLAAVASSSAGASSSNESVRWTVAAEEQVRSALSEETRSILLTAWEQDSELLDFTSRGGRHFAQPLVQEEHGTEMHHTLAWAEDGGLPKAAASQASCGTLHGLKISGCAGAASLASRIRGADR